MEKLMIVAVSENNVIGKDGDIPWDIPEDMKHFREKTTGHSVIMGRKTYESLPENYRPRPNRRNIVLTRSGLENKPDEVIEASSLEEGWNAAEGYSHKAYITGGESVYREAMSQVDRLVVTRVHEEYKGDTYFPEINKTEWKEDKRDDREGFSFIEYVRKD